MAHLEFLIGVLAVINPPDGIEAWVDDWSEPPTPDRLSALLAPYRFSFDLDGDGARFMQDYADLAGEPDVPETLLIEAPGESTRRNNTALLVKPGRVRVLSRRAAAMALFTLQTYAPAGGRGNLTSVRGGGPMTTLAIPPPSGNARLDLWRLVWANVPYGRPVPVDELPRVLPWLAPTRTAETFPRTTDADVDWRQAFWGMPRRIRLEFAANPQRLPCDLTGEIDDVIVTGWRQRPNGVKYDGFQHSLSPYYHDAKAGRLPLHPQPGGIGYRHWRGLAIQNEDTGRQRAACIRNWHERTQELPREMLEGTRLLACGYDMDNMKARGFVESEMPLPAPDDEQRAGELAGKLVPATEIVARTLRFAVRNACGGKDGSSTAAVYESLWSETQADFFDRLMSGPSSTEEGVAAGWRALLEATALRLFDAAAPLEPSVVSFDFKRIVEARSLLVNTLRGYGKSGEGLFGALGLAKPDSGKSKRKRGKAA